MPAPWHKYSIDIAYRMSDFQNTVMTIATVILIICIIVVGVMILNERTQVAWPPVVPQCPNNYILNESGKCEGTVGGSPVDPLCGTPGTPPCSSKQAHQKLCKAVRDNPQLDYDGVYNTSYFSDQCK